MFQSTVFYNNYTLHFRGILTIEEIVINGLNQDLNAPIQVRSAGKKGRGVFATENIHKNSYICEYKTTKVYRKEEYQRKMKEAAANNEVSAAIEHKVGRTTLYFDTTRRMNQYGRYMNHGRKNANIKVCRPLAVRGRLRIGMYSVDEITAGDELLWDYGIPTTEMPWEGTKKFLLHPSFQMYQELSDVFPNICCFPIKLGLCFYSAVYY